MKKQDWILILCVIVILTPFFIPATGFFDWFNTATTNHPYIMAFFKFAILATLGECLALRIREGVYTKKGFGVLPRMMVWGFLGMCIAMAMVIFKTGVPTFLESVGGCDKGSLAAVFSAPTFTWGKLGIAFAVSVTNSYLLNSRFTFQSEEKRTVRQHLRAYVRTVASYALTGLFLAPAIKMGLVGLNIPFYIASLASLLVTIPINFILNKFWAFRKKEPAAETAASKEVESL